MSPQPLDGRCRLDSRRRLAIGGLALTSALVAGLVVAAPAQALAPAPVTTKAALSGAVQSGQARIVLGADLTDEDGTPSTANDVQTVPAGVSMTLDLHGHDLDLDRIVVSDGASLTVTDLTANADDDSEHELRVDAGSLGGTAVELRGNAHLTVQRTRVDANGGEEGAGVGTAPDDATGGGSLVVDTDGRVTAAGGDGGAGVGGGQHAKAIDVTVDGGSMTAWGGLGAAGIGSGQDGSGGSLTTEGSGVSVYAYGGGGGAGIGGGLRADGGTVQLSGDTDVSAEQGAVVDGLSASAVGAGEHGSAFGSLSIGEEATLRLSSSATLHLPTGTTVENDGRIRLNGTIDGAGTIVNTGGIDTPESYDDDQTAIDPSDRIASGIVVKGRNYLIALDPNGGTTTGHGVAHVWSSRLRPSTFASPSGRDGKTFFSWNSSADGRGSDADGLDVDDLTADRSVGGTPVDLRLYAQYGYPVAFTATTMADAGYGQAYDQVLPVTGEAAQYFDVDDWDPVAQQRIVALPPGLAVDNDSGHIAGVPTQTGTWRFHASAGGAHSSADAWITIEVAGAPTVATTALPESRAGAAYAARVQASGKGAFTYSIASGSLPAGITLNGATGELSGTPTAAGASAFVMKVTSPFGSTLQALTLAVGSAQAPAAAPAAPAAPTLATVPRTTVRFGHRLDLGVTASSTLPVSYRIASGALPKGITLNPQTGVISGTASAEGVFTAVVAVSSGAGTATTPVVIEVPPVRELLSAPSVPGVEVGGGRLPLKVTGLLKGERWTVQVDGKVVARGKAKRAGALSTSVRLRKPTKDTVHVIVVSGSRAMADPATRASTVLQVASLAAKKHLAAWTDRDASGVRMITVRGLGAAEVVTARVGHKTVAKGHANERGVFSFLQRKAGAGTKKVVVRGAAVGRTDTLTIKNSQH